MGGSVPGHRVPLFFKKKGSLVERIQSTNPFKNQSLDAMNSATEESEVDDLAGDG